MPTTTPAASLPVWDRQVTSQQCAGGEASLARGNTRNNQAHVKPADFRLLFAAAVEFVVASVPHLARLDRMPWKHKLGNIGSRF